MKSVSDNLVVTCDYNAANTSTNLFNKKATNKIDYYFLHTIF